MFLEIRGWVRTASKTLRAGFKRDRPEHQFLESGERQGVSRRVATSARMRRADSLDMMRDKEIVQLCTSNVGFNSRVYVAV